MGEAFFVMYRNLRAFSVGSYAAVDWKWDKKYIQPLSKVLSRKSIEVNRKQTPLDDIKLLTIHFDGSIDPRNLNSNISFKGKLYYAYSGDVVYSKIDVRNGAIGIVPPYMPQIAVSSEYPVYSVNSDLADAKFIHLIFRTSAFQKILNSMISGTSGRKRVQPSQIESVEIPLPPLNVQRAIITKWQDGQNKIFEAKHALESVTYNLNEKLFGIYYENTKTDVMKSRFMTVSWGELSGWDIKSARAAAFRSFNKNFRPLSDFVEEATELSRPYEETEKDWAVYGVNNKEGVFFSHYQKGRDFNTAYKKIYKDWFFHNPTRSSVGSLGIVPEVPENAITSPEYQVWRIKQGLIPGYVATLIRTPFFISLIQFHRVGAVKQRLYVENLLEIRVPVISEHEQQEIANAREQALAQISQAEAEAKVINAEVEAMILGTKKV